MYRGVSYHSMVVGVLKRRQSGGDDSLLICSVYKIPESARALCKIVSLTAAKTRRILDVSVACVKLITILASFVPPPKWARLTEGINSNARG